MVLGEFDDAAVARNEDILLRDAHGPGQPV